MKPIRSALYMPASNRRALAKIDSLDADAYILDLEDAVAPNNKDEARASLAEYLSRGERPAKTLIARVNGLDSIACENDVKALAEHKIAALLFPKIEHRQDVLDAIDLMDKYQYSPAVGLWLMIETPLAVINIADIIRAHPRVACLVMGTSDLAKDMGVAHSQQRQGLQYALGQVLLHAKAFQKEILDGVHLDLSDEPGFELACHQGKQWGFDGKTLIHPKQIAACHQAFSPTEQELAQAQAIVSLWETMQQERSGVALLDGKLIEKLHVDQAKRLLDIYRLEH